MHTNAEPMSQAVPKGARRLGCKPMTMAPKRAAMSWPFMPVFECEDGRWSTTGAPASNLMPLTAAGATAELLHLLLQLLQRLRLRLRLHKAASALGRAAMLVPAMAEAVGMATAKETRRIAGTPGEAS